MIPKSIGVIVGCKKNDQNQFEYTVSMCSEKKEIEHVVEPRIQLCGIPSGHRVIITSTKNRQYFQKQAVVTTIFVRKDQQAAYMVTVHDNEETKLVCDLTSQDLIWIEAFGDNTGYISL